jgi:hypothetical protein
LDAVLLFIGWLGGSRRKWKRVPRLCEENPPAPKPEEAGEQDEGRRALCEAIEEDSALRNRTFKPAVLSGFQIAAAKEIFRAHVLNLLVDLELLPSDRLKLLLCWKHSGFNVHHGAPVPLENKAELEKLAQYILRNPFSVKKMNRKQLANHIYPGLRRHGTVRGCLRKNSSTTSSQHRPGGLCITASYFAGADCASPRPHRISAPKKRFLRQFSTPISDQRRDSMAKWRQPRHAASSVLVKP